jgi:hypothetical protein
LGLLGLGLLLGSCGSDDGATGPDAREPPEVVFEPPGGGFAGEVQVTLRGRGGADVRYTLDGSAPDSDSPLYSTPIRLLGTTLLRARAVREADGGVPASAAVDQLYVHLAPDARDFDSNLPLVVVHMLGEDKPDRGSREYVPAAIALFEPATAGRTRLEGTATHTSRIGIKIRGRSTRDQPKSNYTLELWGEDDDDAPYPLLGMPSDGDWVLYAPFANDRSLVRNAFIYALSNRIGRYAPRTRFCEVFLVMHSAELRHVNYAGIYSLT